MKIEIHGRQVEVDDSFKDMSEDEQHQVVDEIAAGLMPTASEAAAAQEAQESQGPDVLPNIGAGAEATALRYGVGVPAVWGIDKLKKLLGGADKALPAQPAPSPQTISPSLSGKELWNQKLTGFSAPGSQMDQESLEMNKRLRSIVGRGGEFSGGTLTPGGIAIPPELKPGFQPKPAVSQNLVDRTKQLSSGLDTLRTHPAGKAFTSGYNLMDVVEHAGEGPLGNVQATASGLAALAPYAEKYLPGKYKKVAKALQLGTPAANYVIDKFTGQPVPVTEQKAAGGAIQHFQKGKFVTEGGSKVMEMLKNKKLPGDQSSFAQRVLSPPTAEEIAKFTPKPTKDVKYSDAIQNHLGEYLGLHMSDPYGVHGGRMGGTGFGNFQNINPLHAKNKVVWMNDSEEAAKKLAGQQQFNGSPIVWSNYIGSPTQHISNKSVANEILQDVYKNHSNMSPDVAERTNELLQKKFGIKDLDIRDKDAMSELLNKSFDARKQFGHIAEGFGAGKNKIVLSPNLQNILDESRDPFIAGANTSEIGTRLSRIHNDAPQFSTDFHPDYRWTVHGEDLGVRFPSVPQSVAVPDWFKRYQENNFSKTGKPLEPHGNAWFGYMKTPQKINEDYIKYVQAEGFAPGGKVMKAAVEEFKKKFTPGFYHGSPSPSIKAFDASKGDRAFPTEGVTFVTRDPDFADSFLGMNRKGQYEKGSTMYPVSVNLGKHFVPGSKEGHKLIDKYIATQAENPWSMLDNQERAAFLKKGAWDAMEDPKFLQYLQDTGHDTFTVMEGGIPNVGIFDPKHIRGKFAKYNPEDAESPDFMKAAGGLIHLAPGGKVPEAVVKAYKLFRTKGGNTDELYPLFVNANKPVPMGEWVPAEVGPVAASGKVKSKLGELAYRPGWHAGDLPIATHIGGKSSPTLKAPDFRRPDEVWAEVEMPNDVDWQTIANQRAALNKAGQIIPRTAHITDEVPFGGHYRYKTSPNMQGNWLIGGDMKVNRVLTDEEVQAINEAAGAADLPRFTPLK